MWQTFSKVLIAAKKENKTQDSDVISCESRKHLEPFENKYFHLILFGVFCRKEWMVSGIKYQMLYLQRKDLSSILKKILCFLSKGLNRGTVHCNVLFNYLQNTVNEKKYQRLTVWFD